MKIIKFTSSVLILGLMEYEPKQMELLLLLLLFVCSCVCFGSTWVLLK